MGWADDATSSGHFELAQEHGQIWAGFIKLLDELVIGLEILFLLRPNMKKY